MRHEKELKIIRVFVCASCHHPGGQLVKVDKFYFHPKCPKIVRPFPKKKEEKNESKR